MRRATRSRGIAVVWASITLLVMVMFVGLSLDFGYVHYAAHQLQNAADAAALAGAARVKFDSVDAVTQAVNTAARNYAARQTVQLDAGAGDVVVGNYDRSTATFSANATPLNAVRVIARRTVSSPGGPINLFFGRIFGVNTSDVARQAIAMSGGTLGAGMIALDRNRNPGFGLNGGVQVNVVGGSIQVNSGHVSSATSVSGSSGQILAEQLRINGGLSTSGNPSLPADTYTNTTWVPDPLINLPAPAKTTPLPAVNVSGNRTVAAGPGYYPGGISMNNGTLNLSPGIYVLGPPGLSANGGTINAPGVMFYLTSGNNPTQYGRVDIGGNVRLNQTPPTSGSWAGISMFADRNAPYPTNPNSTNTLIGNAASSLSGTLYFPSTPLAIGGTSNLFANQVIAATIAVSGNGVLRVNYDGRNPVEINNVFLVK